MANFFDQFDGTDPAARPPARAQRVVRPAPASPAADGNFFDQFDEGVLEVPLGEAALDPSLEAETALALRHADGRLTEAGWEAEKAQLAAKQESDFDERSFFENLVAGYGRAAPTMWAGIKQRGTELAGMAAAPIDQALGTALGDPIDASLASQREAIAQERRDSQMLMDSGGGIVGNILGDVALTAPLGAVGVAPKGASAAQAIGRAAGVGAGTGYLQPTAEDGELGRNVALGAGLGGGLAGAGRGLMKVAENVLPTNVTARVLNLFQGKANETPYAEAGEQLAQRTGIELSPAAVSGSRAMTGAENMARSSLFSADKAFAADEKVATQAISYVNRVMDRISTNNLSPQGIGDGIQRTVREAVQKITKSREDVAASQFGVIRRLVGDRPVVDYSNTKQTLNEIVGEFTDVIGGDPAKIRRQAESLLAEISQKDGYTLDAARRARGFYGRAASRSANVFDDVNPDINARLARRLYAAMSRDLDAAAEKVDELVGFGKGALVPDGMTAQKPSELLRQANDDYRRHSQLLEAVEKGPLRRLLGDEVNVDDFMTVNTLPPETVIARIGSMKTTELNQVRDFMQRNAPDTWQSYKRMLVDDALSEAQTFPASAGAKTLPFNAGGFVRAIGGDKPAKMERLRAIFDQTEMGEIDDALQAARRLGDKFGANFSGTGPYNEMVAALRNFTIRGLSTTATTAAGFNNIARLMSSSDGRRAVIELSRVPAGGKKANDLAAYLAGIAGPTVAEAPPLEIDVTGGNPVSPEEFERISREQGFVR